MMMTPKQESYINALIKKKENSEEVANDFEYFDYMTKSRMTSKVASELIGELLKLRDKSNSQLDLQKISKQVYYILDHKKSKKWAMKLDEICERLGVNWINKQTNLTDEQLQSIKDLVF